ncbi:MAG: 5'-3' exonuclease H3TH domain-containing protein [Xanthomonadales bacterium]|nr:5'-3' exonuclease H3TH domain-containing protein [Xanthomonadales bacterium]
MAALRVCLVDASVYLYRAWFGAPPRHDAAGRPVQALAGFLEFLAELLAALRPPLLALAFDAERERSFRRRIAPDYKANRPPAPPELARQFGLAREAAALLGIALLADPELEADDLIGSAREALLPAGIGADLISSDKDLGQVLEPGDRLWDFGRRPPLGPEGLRARFGVAPHQLADFLALCGDRSDNVRGVPGVGPRTAAALLRAFGDLETLCADPSRVAQLPLRGAARLAERLDRHRAELERARRLTAIRRDAEVPRLPARYRPRPTERSSLAAFAREHGLRPETLARVEGALSACAAVAAPPAAGCGR